MIAVTENPDLLSNHGNVAYQAGFSHQAAEFF